MNHFQHYTKGPAATQGFLVKNFIKFWAGLMIMSVVMGWAMFQHYHAEKIMQIEKAKVTSNIIAIHALTNGKIKELAGEEVKAGEVIAKIEVSVTDEEIQKLQQGVEAAKRSYDSLKLGQQVKTPVRRTKPAAAQPTATVATLQERVKRLEELYEMGAVSKGELDKAKQDLSKATTPAPAQSQTVEIDFVDSIQPTPPAILQNAENALKEAELALNVAVEQSKQTEITAPVDGVVYYNYTAGEEIKAGDIIAKIGDDKNVWIEAEVSEDIFNQVALGKKVSYTIDGHNLSGTVTEKIAEPEKFILKVSIPAERNFNLKLLEETTLKISM